MPLTLKNVNLSVVGSVYEVGNSISDYNIYLYSLEEALQAVASHTGIADMIWTDGSGGQYREGQRGVKKLTSDRHDGINWYIKAHKVHYLKG